MRNKLILFTFFCFITLSSESNDNLLNRISERISPELFNMCFSYNLFDENLKKEFNIKNTAKEDIKQSIKYLDKLKKREEFEKYLLHKNDIDAINKMFDVDFFGDLSSIFAVHSFISLSNKYPMKILRKKNISCTNYDIYNVVINFSKLSKNDKEFLIEFILVDSINSLFNMSNVEYYKTGDQKSTGLLTFINDIIIFCYLSEFNWDNINIDEEFKTRKNSDILKRVLVYTSKKIFDDELYFEMYNNKNYNRIVEVKSLFCRIHPNLSKFYRDINMRLINNIKNTIN